MSVSHRSPMLPHIRQEQQTVTAMKTTSMSLQVLVVGVCVTVISVYILGSMGASIARRKTQCNAVPDNVLGEILGPAFNSRYMSVNEPQAVDNSATGLKRAPVESSFYVDDQFVNDVSDTPAWNTNHLAPRRASVPVGKRVDKRAIKSIRQWECQSRIRWHDLGPDYYPRYLRSVECTSQSCWYDMMSCKPRSFTVKILRRKRDRCVEDANFKSGSVGLPRDLRELWVWEERAVNFCCDCAF